MSDGVTWIVELEKGVWLAPVSGDPGRTLVPAHAKRFSSLKAAEAAIRRAQKLRPLCNAKAYRVPPTLAPCPNCGGSELMDLEGFWTIECRRCCMRGPYVDPATGDLLDKYEAWNSLPRVEVTR